MYFFAVVFIVAVIIALNIYAKKDPVTKDKVAHEIEFEKELCEPNEEFVLKTEVENKSLHPMGRIYVKHTLDTKFELSNEKKYKAYENNNKKQIICRTHVRGRKNRKIETHLKIPNRGVYRTYGIDIDCLDFFGFHISYYTRKTYEKIVVAPKRIDDSFVSAMICSGYGDFNAKRGFIDDETTIRTYGEYTGHEPMRHINWKKSAQAEDFVVKQFEPMGAHVTTIVFDITGYANLKEGWTAYDLLEYSISMLREIFEYFETKRISYRLYTNAKSPLLYEHMFTSVPSGAKTRKRMLMMLGEMSLKFTKGESPCNSNTILNLAIKNTARAPFVYLAPTNRSIITKNLKKISKVKGIEIVELYAENFFKKKKG